LFKNRVLRRIFGPKSDEVTRVWRKLCNKDFKICTLHQIMNKPGNEMDGHAECMVMKRNAHIVLDEKPEEKTQA
jgi:hypothetical protein